MESIDIAYEINIEGTQFNVEVIFFDTTPEFKNIRLKPIGPSPYDYHLLVKKNVFSTSTKYLQPIFSESTLEIQKFIYIFSASADIKITNFKCIGYFKNDKLRKLEEIFPSNYITDISANLIVTAGHPALNKIKKKMKSDYDLASLQMFYDSATVKEPIGRFASLYTLMLHLCSDKQLKVDRTILNIDPTVAQFKRPNKKGYETIFTKLRNEISHKRDGINILKTHDEIKNNIDRFEKIVKEIILNKS